MTERLWLFAHSLAAFNLVVIFLCVASLRFRVVLAGGGRRERREASAPAAFAHSSAGGDAIPDLTSWIDEVEREDHAPVPPSGSEAWWRAFAAGGGQLPEAADPCRGDERGAARNRPVPSTDTALSHGARGVA